MGSWEEEGVYLMGLWEQELSTPPQDLLPAVGVTSGLLSLNNTVTKAGWTL